LIFEIEIPILELVSLMFVSWNHIGEWLRRVDQLRLTSLALGGAGALVNAAAFERSRWRGGRYA
jgi:hypothetical protein